MQNYIDLLDTHQYDSIIDLPRPDFGRHAHMSMVDRGAQFSPFAALVGYDAVIEETARLTEQDTDLAEGGIAMLDEALRQLNDRLAERPTVRITWFRPDSRKSGGSTRTTEGIVKKIDLYTGALILEDGQQIGFEMLKDIAFVG